MAVERPGVVALRPDAPAVPDHELVAVSLGRNKARARWAFGQLVRRHEGAVRLLLRSLCRSHAQADDLAQDAFMKAWQALEQLKDPDKFQPWLKRLAYREFLHAYRRAQVEHRFLQTQADAALLVDPLSLEDLDEEVTQILSWCTREQAEMLVLSYAFGFKIDEIAQDRDMPAGTVKSLIHRAKQTIQAQLRAQAERGVQRA